MSVFAMEPLVKNAWYIAAWPHEIDDGLIARKILGEDIVLFRSGDGSAGALEDRCCHRGVKLSLGTAKHNGMQCGYHGMVFDASGACVDNPGEALNPSFCVRAFPIKERQNFIWIWMGDPARADEEQIIDYPYHDMTEEFNYHYGRYEIAANYMFLVDNLMDLTHLGYVHLSTIGGNPEESDNAEMTTTRTEHGAHFNRWMPNSTPPPSFVKAGGFEGKIDRWQDFEYVSPSSVLQCATAHDAGTGGLEEPTKPGGLLLRVFHHATPMDDNNYHYFFSTAVRGQAFDGPGNISFHDANLEAFLEDKIFIESQQEAVGQAPERPLLLREHDKALAYSRQAIHKLQATDVSQAAE